MTPALPLVGHPLAGGGTSSPSFCLFGYSIYTVLPEEIVERIAACMDLGYHLVKVSAKLVDTDFFTCGNEDAWCVFLRDPTVLELLKSVIYLLFRLQRELVILFVFVRINLVEYDKDWLVYGLDILQCLLYYTDMILEIRV